MRRRVLALLIALGLGLATWLRSTPLPSDDRPNLTLERLTLDPTCCRLGPLRLEAAWQLTSRHSAFGGYSALLTEPQGRLLAFSDRGYYLEVSKPDGPARPPRFGVTLSDRRQLKNNRDVESATREPQTGRIWLALEGRNAIARHDADLRREAFREERDWKGWSNNAGAEAMVRLTDGRFVVLCECRTSWLGVQHPAFLYAGDPTSGIKGQAFTFEGGGGYRPTDMAELPDGRVLILARRLLWPMPARFAIKVLIADPAEIRPGQVWNAKDLGELSGGWPVDNYEGLAIERQADGSLIAWIISDENGAASQRVLLLKVAIDEARLPPKQKAPG